MHSASESSETSNVADEVEVTNQQTNMHEQEQIYHINNNVVNSNQLMSSQKGSLEPFRTITMWAGEWPYVKRGISEVRETLVHKAIQMSERLQLQRRYNTLQHSRSALDEFTRKRSFEVYNTFQRHRWMFSACGVLFLSGYVAVRSAPWGTYAMIRNGLISSAVLTFILFPSQLLNSLDALSPFSAAPILAPTNVNNKKSNSNVMNKGQIITNHTITPKLTTINSSNSSYVKSKNTNSDNGESEIL